MWAVTLLNNAAPLRTEWAVSAANRAAAKLIREKSSLKQSLQMLAQK